MTELESSLISRLKDFISSTGLNNSQFADACRIPRPSLSQILTGRNKKVSNQLIEQIHEAYPNLNIIWLLFGEGDMIPSSTSPNADSQSGYGEPQPSSGVSEGPAGAETTFLPTNGSIDSLQPKENGLTTPSNLAGTRMNKGIEADLKIHELQLQIEKLQLQVANMTQNPRKVASITVYYDDSTFETFVPSSKPQR